MIHCDSREPKLMQAKLKLHIPSTSVVYLDWGDYVVFDQDGHSAGVERKTVSDLLHSAATSRQDGRPRLHAQMEALAQTYDLPILLIEGTLGFEPATGQAKVKGRLTGWQHGAVQMMVLSFQQQYGVSVLWTEDATATVDALRVLHGQAQTKCLLRHRPEVMHEQAAA
jgi:ERCC4-type nuclease